MKLAEKMKTYGALRLGVKLGEEVELIHNGESIKVSVTGNQGQGYYYISFKGSKTFRISRATAMSENGK